MTDLITVTADNVDKTGFFCKMSARGKPGYEQKLSWLKARFAEGLQMRLLGGGERGFIEFIPGQYAWRAIRKAKPYVVIHCLWVVGRSKGKGHGSVLLEEAEAHARREGFAGVAAVTSGGNWLMRKDILANRGYTSVAQVEPSFDLMVRKFDDAVADPAFCGGWAKKLTAHAKGLVVYRTAQCPYLDDATLHAKAAAEELGLPFREVELTSAAKVRAQSPTPFGVFAVVHNGRLVSPHFLLKKDIVKHLRAA